MIEYNISFITVVISHYINHTKRVLNVKIPAKLNIQKICVKCVIQGETKLIVGLKKIVGKLLVGSEKEILRLMQRNIIKKNKVVKKNPTISNVRNNFSWG